MPPYFYHLAFQLYPHPPTSSADEIANDNNKTDSEHLAQDLSPNASIEDCLQVLRLKTDTFPFVTARSSSDSTGTRSRRPGFAGRSLRISSHNSQSHHNIPSLPTGASPSESGARPTYLLDGPLCAKDKADDSASDNSRQHRKAEKEHDEQEQEGKDIINDWRFGKVEIDWVDMIRNHNHTQRSASSEQPLFGGAMQGKYIPAHSKTLQVGWGVVHLFRDALPSTSDDEMVRQHDGSKTEKHGGAIGSDDVGQNCTTLCILAVPTYMTPSDLLGWLGEQTREEVSHLRLVRTGRANRYMVLMKFRDARACKRWQREWNGKLFNSMEPENCHVVFLKSIFFEKAVGSKKDPSSFPDMSRDPFTPAGAGNGGAQMSSAVVAGPLTTETSSRTSTSLTSKPAPPPTPALVELPTCPVCLERMDETTGLATIFCQHVFHCACLQKWRGSGCPVCRYTHNEHSHVHKGKVNAEEEECKACGATSNLWICLICGNVGCGRYDEAHAFAHYEQTSHAFAMDIVTQRVWDYAGDGYVHRLIQNKSDGKLVELPSARGDDDKSKHTPQQQQLRQEKEFPLTEKMDQISIEYTALLTSQLDSQRMYFEEQVDRAVDKATKASIAADVATTAAEKATSALETVQTTQALMTSETLPTLERTKERAERRAERFESMARSMEREWREAEVINESLMERIKHLEAKLEEAETKGAEMEEQNRDLTFFISGMERLKGEGEDVRLGSVSVAEAPPPQQPDGATRKKMKKKAGKR